MAQKANSPAIKNFKHQILKFETCDVKISYPKSNHQPRFTPGIILNDVLYISYLNGSRDQCHIDELPNNVEISNRKLHETIKYDSAIEDCEAVEIP